MSIRKYRVYHKGDILLLLGFDYFPFAIEVKVVKESVKAKTSTKSFESNQVNDLVYDIDGAIYLVLNKGDGTAIGVDKVIKL